MTKRQIMNEAMRIADEAGLFGLKRFEYLTKVYNSELHKNAPEREIATREQFQTEIRNILDAISFEGFFSNRNRNKK